jgi:large conductance mechanosensitive channel
VRNDFQELVFTVRDVEIRYGAFISAIINFVIMAFIIFLMVKAINKLSSLGKKKEEVALEVTTKKCPYCMSEIAIEATRCPHCTSELN